MFREHKFSELCHRNSQENMNSTQLNIEQSLKSLLEKAES